MSAVAEATRLLPPLSDTVVTAVSRLLDDRENPRDPSHSVLTSHFERTGLIEADPPKPTGKEKRVRAILGWALENNEVAGRALVGRIISEIRGCGGFRPESANYVGADAIENARAAFRSEGFDLSLDGILLPVAFEGLTGADATEALRTYARRAARGADDNPLVVGTSKDLLEATAAHVLNEHFGSYPQGANFPSLLGQAFVALNLATPVHTEQPGEPARCRVERSLYELACSVNALRNREGTGHGRPWLSSVSEAEARLAIRAMGTISDFLLDALQSQRK
ncbi:MAG: abortive infection family protein [Gaiellaceae bacterium]